MTAGMKKLIIQGIGITWLLGSLAALERGGVFPKNFQGEAPEIRKDFHIHAQNPPDGLTLTDGGSYYTYQWALKNVGNLQRISEEGERKITNSVAGVDIAVEPAWTLYEQKPERRTITVALIDTGAEITHPELQHAIWINEDEIPGDGIDNDGNGYVDDVNGWNFHAQNNQLFVGTEDEHGTHEAGIIAGAWDGKGITGIADSNYVKIMVLKALGTEQGTGLSDGVKQAIRYAGDNGADICNLSMGAENYDEEMEQMMRESPMLFVVSAGNGDGQGNGYDIDASPVYPAAYSGENIITVANMMFDGNLDSSSNYGASGVDIAAPGTYILSTVPGGYGFLSGTSMAAPMVTGAAALLASCCPELGPADIKRLILDSATRRDSLAGKCVTGGMLNVQGAMMAE